MIRRFVSAAAEPFDRGQEFGREHASQIARVVDRYRELWSSTAGRTVEPEEFGADAMAAIESFSAAAADEIRGIALGAGLDFTHIAAINARTEVLAALGAQARAECSTVVKLDRAGGAPTTVQTWDWHDTFADDWLLWSIEHPDGTIVHTMTEYGILGKIGVNNHGVGVHLNILHHRLDGGPIATPIHVLARTILDRSRGIGKALELAGSATTSASSVFTLVGADADGTSALSAELSPAGPRFVLPDDTGLLIHTNHFLDPVLAAEDREPRVGPDSYLRFDILRGRLAGRTELGLDDVLDAMSSHHGGGGALCCHPDPATPLVDRWQTLVTIALDVAAGTLRLRAWGPCSSEPWEDSPAIVSDLSPTIGVN